MDSQDYLDQISKSARPMKPAKKGIVGIITSKYFMWGMIALAILVVAIIFGSMLGGKTTIEERCITLNLRLTNTSGVITEYQPSVKSSLLRSLSASLNSILTNTSAQLKNYMVKAYEYKDEKVKESLVEEANLNKDSLESELFEAKINGLLDRTFSHKMALEIYSIMSDEASIVNSTNEDELKTLLNTSRTSLENLYTQFNDFSETK